MRRIFVEGQKSGLIESRVIEQRAQPLRAKPGTGTKIKTGPPANDKNNGAPKNDKKDDSPDDPLCYIEID